MESLAEDVTQETYERCAVQDFGKDYMKNFGWDESQDAKPDANKPVIYEGRQKNLGLGAKPLTMEEIKAIKNMGKNVNGKRTRSEAFGKGRLNHNDNSTTLCSSIDNHKNAYFNKSLNIDNEDEIKINSKVYIYKGNHKGLTGTVRNIVKLEEAGILGAQDQEKLIKLTIELDINQTEVKVSQSKVVLEKKRQELIQKGAIQDESLNTNKDADLDSDRKREKKSRNKSHSQNSREKKSKKYKKSKKHDKKSKKHKKSKKKKHKRSSSVSSDNSDQSSDSLSVPWALPNLIVRVITQEDIRPSENSSFSINLYNTKIRILDVMADGSFSFIDNKNGIYENCISFKDIETVMPQIGDQVRIVKGSFRGKAGTLLQRDKKANTVSVIIGAEVVNLTQDD